MDQKHPWSGARIDLHAHSSHSDGTDVPARLIAEAAAAGLDVVALTDHDVTDGWAEAGRAGREHGVTVVPGIEVSCSWHGISVHLLAYLPDPTDVALSAELERSRTSRRTRMARMVERLAADGFPVSMEEVRAQAGPDATLGRPHLADVLVAHGRYPDRSAAFADVLAADSPYYVSHYAPDPVRAVELVVGAGGAAVVAHPFASVRGRVVEDSVIEAMAAAGMVGIEVDHRDHGEAERARARALADRLDLVRTGASDYHGAGKPNRLGENLTEPVAFGRLLGAAHGTELLGAPEPSAR